MERGFLTPGSVSIKDDADLRVRVPISEQNLKLFLDKISRSVFYRGNTECSGMGGAEKKLI